MPDAHRQQPQVKALTQFYIYGDHRVSVDKGMAGGSQADYLAGIEFGPGSVHIKGQGGFCKDKIKLCHYIKICFYYLHILPGFEGEGFKDGMERGRAEGRTEGIGIGEKKGFLDALIGLVKDGILTLSDAAQRANMTVAEFQKKTGLDTN